MFVVDVRALRYFLAVADHLHFGRAAQQLWLSTSALSRCVSELERELGQDLFTRGYHQVQLTQFGHEFAHKARPIVGDFDKLKQLGWTAAVGPRCRIGATPLLNPKILDDVLDAFRINTPEVDCPITLASSAELLSTLAKEDIDVAIVHLPAGDPKIASLVLATTRIAILMRADDPLASRCELRLAEVADRHFVFRSTDPHPTLMENIQSDLERAGITRITRLPHNDAVQIATHIHRSGALTWTCDANDWPSAPIYNTENFVKVPVCEPQISISAGIAWLKQPTTKVDGLAQALETLRK